MQGFISLHRKILENPIFNDAGLLQLFIYCLLRANFEEKKVIFNRGEVVVPRGSFISGRFVIAKALNVKPPTVVWRLKTLELLCLISLKTNNKFTIINIVKYNDYQIKGKSTNNGLTTNYQRTITDNNDNNNNNDNKEQCDVFKSYPHLSNELFKKSWSDYVNHRIQIKHKLTSISEGRLLKRLNKFDVLIATKMIEESLIQGWQGIFEFKSNNYKNNKVAEVFSVKVRKCSGCNQNLTDGGVCYTSECSNYAQRVSSVPVGLANLININGKTN